MPPLCVSWLPPPALVSVGLCALLSVSGLAPPLLSWFCFSFSILGWSAVYVSFGCVSSGPSRWGHPCQGRVSVVCSSTRSERRLSLLVSFVFLRDGVTLWVKCVLHTLLIAIEGLPLAVCSCSFRLGSPAGYCCLRLVFPWVCIIVCLYATLLFPVWLLSALWASFSWHPFLASLCCALGHWFFFLPYFVIFAWYVLSLSLYLFLSCPSLRSLGGPPVPSWPSVVSLTSASLWVLVRVVFSSCLGLQLLVLGVPGCLPRVFFSGSVASLPSLSGSLALLGYPVCPLPRSFSVRSLVAFVCHLRAVLLLSLVPVSRFISLVLPLSLRVLALSLCLLALLFVLFLEPLFALPRGVFSSASSSSSLALSSSSVLSESRPPGVSAVAASSTFARTASLSSVLDAASWSSLWFSPLAIFLLCCSPLGVV